jgi:hypothetical protein
MMSSELPSRGARGVRRRVESGKSACAHNSISAMQAGVGVRRERRGRAARAHDTAWHSGQSPIPASTLLPPRNNAASQRGESTAGS